MEQTSLKFLKVIQKWSLNAYLRNFIPWIVPSFMLECIDLWTKYEPLQKNFLWHSLHSKDLISWKCSIFWWKCKASSKIKVILQVLHFSGSSKSFLWNILQCLSSEVRSEKVNLQVWQLYSLLLKPLCSIL